MSDPEVPNPEHKSDVDDVVDSANAGLAEAQAAGANVADAAASAAQPAADQAPVVGSADDAPIDHKAIDPDLAAFEAAEREHPGTFDASEPPAPASAGAEPATTGTNDEPVLVDESAVDRSAADKPSTEASIADTAYLPPAADAETRVVPSEPVAAEPVRSEPDAADTLIAPLQQPIFVQAPEPPRDRGNRGAAAGIGLLATLSFAILYLGTALGFGALAGDVTGENVGEAALAPLTTWGFWVPVVVFFIGFWLLGALINRGRWGLWVVFGIIVGLFAYGGHILGQLFEAPFWELSARGGAELVTAQLFAPLAIAAFVFGRELTIWFGAWVARSGARKTELNIEARREYDRTIEAGPTLSR